MLLAISCYPYSSLINLQQDFYMQLLKIGDFFFCSKILCPTMQCAHVKQRTCTIVFEFPFLDVSLCLDRRGTRVDPFVVAK